MTQEGTTKDGSETRDYYREASSWGHDREASIARSRRTAWIVAGAATGVALLEGLALILLMPLKTVEPYTLLVDKQTGYVSAVKPLEAQKVADDTALTQSFLVQYVIARESFDIDTLQADYRKVALWSAENARSQYIAGMQANAATSPLNLYPRSALVETAVKSVSPMGPNVAMVRFETRLTARGGEPQTLGSWVAVIRYRYSGEPMAAGDRYLNPLGFKVVRYRRDAEVLPTPIAPPSNREGEPAGVIPMRSPVSRAAP